MTQPEIRLVDVSAQAFGKYQFCTKGRDGLWYADEDFTFGSGVGKPKPGALPAPHQDTPELTAKARAMHEAAAAQRPPDKTPFWRRRLARFR